MAMKFRAGGRRRLPKRFVLFTVLVVLVLSTMQFLSYLDSNLRPTLMKAAEAYSKEVATKAINESIAKRLSSDIDYAKLINFREGKDGKVQAGFFNLQEAGKIQEKATMSIQHDLHNLEQTELKLPMGVALGNSLLAAVGPDVPITITPVGHVQSKVDWEVREAGINQTVHILYLEIHVDASVIIPFSTKQVDVTTKAPIAYLVMVGDVPQMVFNAKGESLTGNGTGNASLVPPIQLPDLNKPAGE